MANPVSPAVTLLAATHRLRQLLADVLAMQPEEIDEDVPLTAYGMGSRNGMTLLADLEEWAEVRMDASILADGASVLDLAREVVRLDQEQREDR